MFDRGLIHISLKNDLIWKYFESMAKIDFWNLIWKWLENKNWPLKLWKVSEIESKLH